MLALDVVDLKKTYANGVVALKGLNFHIEEGDCFALLGPNGAGKSTTIGIITSLVKKSAGLVKVFDFNIDTHFPFAKACMGLMPQEFNFNIFETVEQIITNQAGYYGLTFRKAKERTAYYLKRLELWEKRHAQARHLSGGMKRRLMLARALVHEPKLLILDEPTAGVDVEVRRLLINYIREMNQEGKTIILTTHYLEEAEALCNKIAIINEGKLILNVDKDSGLTHLHRETFILNLTQPIETSITIPELELHFINSKTLEINLYKGQTLNELFARLSQHGITVSSLKNKFNRLEELFVNLVQNGKH